MIRACGAGKAKGKGATVRYSPYVTATMPAAVHKPPWQAPEDAAQATSTDPDDGRMIYVGNVPATAEWQELKDHMKTCGHVEFVQVLNNEWGQSRGVGFVRYSNVEEAQLAIESLNGTEMEGMATGKTLTVDLWTGQKPVTNKGRSKAGDASPIGKGGAAMYSSGVGGCYGGKGGCYGGKGGFAGAAAGAGKGGGVWLSLQDYQALIKGKGKGKGAAAAGPGYGSRDPTFKVRVDGLSPETAWQELKDHMKQAGSVEFCNVAAGVGEVRYSCAEEANNAIETLNGTELMGMPIVVDQWS